MEGECKEMEFLEETGEGESVRAADLASTLSNTELNTISTAFSV
jgi:hypothetical protein